MSVTTVPTWQMYGEEEEVKDDRGAEAVDGHGGAEGEGGTAHAAHAAPATEAVVIESETTSDPTALFFLSTYLLG